MIVTVTLNAALDRTLTVPHFQRDRCVYAYMSAKRWIEAGVSPDPAAVTDPATDLKTL